MSERWMVVGEDPDPTEDERVIPWWREDGAPSNITQMGPDFLRLAKPGDRWCRITLPPEPEDEGVEVEGVRYRVDPDDDTLVEYRHPDRKWVPWWGTRSVALKAKVAIALGLVDVPVPADVQAVVDDVLDARKDYTGVQPNRDWWGADLKRFGKAMDSLAALAEPAQPEPSMDGPWKVDHRPRNPTESTPWAVRRHTNTIARCYLEADAIKVRDALNAAPSDWRAKQAVIEEALRNGTVHSREALLAARDAWPPMRPMSELEDEHEEQVLLAHDDGELGVISSTTRVYDKREGRVGWWPLPPVPTTEETKP